MIGVDNYMLLNADFLNCDNTQHKEVTLKHLFVRSLVHNRKIVCFRGQYWAPASPSPNIARGSILFFDNGLGFVQ